jgi:phage shock protein A
MQWGGVEAIVSEAVRKSVKEMSDEEKDRYFESVEAKQEELEASILDGMTEEEVISYGEDFEKATGRDLLPSP